LVLAVIALLRAVAAPRYFDHIQRSRAVVLRDNLNVMRDAIDKFHADRGRYPCWGASRRGAICARCPWIR
jgi:general secretion pathway protein G